MYGSCFVCKDIHVPLISDVDLKEPTAYKQWMVSTEKKMRHGETIFVKLTSKERTLGNFHDQIGRIMPKEWLDSDFIENPAMLELINEMECKLYFLSL